MQPVLTISTAALAVAAILVVPAHAQFRYMSGHRCQVIDLVGSKKYKLQ